MGHLDQLQAAVRQALATGAQCAKREPSLVGALPSVFGSADDCLSGKIRTKCIPAFDSKEAGVVHPQ
jgi:hypothetical protein